MFSLPSNPPSHPLSPRLGTSFGLTLPLFKFWKRARFVPVYLRQSVNEVTGEHTCIMLKELRENQGQSVDLFDLSETSEFWLTQRT